jgi:TPR repeat protein
MSKGRGVDKDPEQALHWFRKAAEQGESECQFLVGVSYYLGKGTDGKQTGSVRVMQKSANGGNPDGQLFLAECCFDGKDVPKDEATAVKWATLAAQNGHPRAFQLLADANRAGSRDGSQQIGSRRMVPKRPPCIENALAQYVLWEMLYFGDGVAAKKKRR